jgi:phosphatidylserine decarboxylase
VLLTSKESVIIIINIVFLILFQKKPPQLVRWDLVGVLLSYLWGSINTIPLPFIIRKILYRIWAFIFRVNLNEIPYPLDFYPTLRDFFSRPLKEGVRTITLEGMASPVDGRVIIFGEITSDRVEQVKGVTYPLSGFLGQHPKEFPTYKNKKLYHCVFYLAPGDYHRVHSPENWKIQRCRHFPGKKIMKFVSFFIFYI